MTKKSIPTPICSTCGVPGGTSFTCGETFYVCPNCGTEMKYLHSGGMLFAGGSEVKKNNGWITTFSMFSTELSTGQVMIGAGVLILVLTISFLFLQKIGSENALWCAGAGIVPIILGARKSMKQKKKMQVVREDYPYWGK
ncbi:MAG: hypothetical protein L6365_01965 [Desulfobulbaceae bacterium]|nr:hypothetical protein [Desulfobulbaceae bacterium]